VAASLLEYSPDATRLALADPSGVAIHDAATRAELLRVAGPGLRLEFVPDAEWKSELMQSWTQADCERLLDAASPPAQQAAWLDARPAALP
jgi:hypothetical protein